MQVMPDAHACANVSIVPPTIFILNFVSKVIAGLFISLPLPIFLIFPRSNSHILESGSGLLKPIDDQTFIFFDIVTVP